MRPARIAAFLGVAAALGLYLNHTIRFFDQVNDDAWITYRYSHFLAAGRGPYFNAGEHVEGYTNFLLMLLLAGVDLALGPAAVPTASKIVGITGGALALLAAAGLASSWLREARRLAPWRGAFGAGAAFLVAENAAFVLHSTTGLETTLFAGLLAAGLLLVERGRTSRQWRGAGGPFALACLTRPEGVLAYAATLAGRLLAGEWRSDDGRRRLLLDSVVVGTVVVGHLAFRMWAYDGEVLPNTYYAKAGGHWKAPREYLGEFAWRHLTPALAPLALVPLASRAPALRAATAPALAILAAAAFAVTFAGTDWMPGYRLLVPYVPAWAALATLGIGLVCDRLRRGSPLLGGFVLAGAIGSASAWQATAAGDYLEQVVAYRLANGRGHEALAAWVATRARPGDAIALMDIGVIGVRLMDLTVVDISGLTDRHIARLPGGFLTKQPDANYVLARRPRFVVLAFAVPAGRPDRARSWTAMERAVLEHPEFKRHYTQPRPAPSASAELARLASLLGAAQAFDATPRSYRYYFAVFTRDVPVE